MSTMLVYCNGFLIHEYFEVVILCYKCSGYDGVYSPHLSTSFPKKACKVHKNCIFRDMSDFFVVYCTPISFSYKNISR